MDNEIQSSNEKKEKEELKIIMPVVLMICFFFILANIELWLFSQSFNAGINDLNQRFTNDHNQLANLIVYSSVNLTDKQCEKFGLVSDLLPSKLQVDENTFVDYYVPVCVKREVN